jgi:putative transcriptional regulator
MITKSNIQPIAGDHFLEGKLLIALPGMSDARFEKTVIYICAHSASTGTMGLIINKPIEELNFRELTQKLGIVASISNATIPILYGGPVETSRGFVLHSSDYQGDASTLPITPTISLTATIDIMTALAIGEGPDQAIFALGYAGWDAGQVEDEMRQNGWLHCDADSKILFDLPHETKWEAALRKLGIDISSLSIHAGHA